MRGYDSRLCLPVFFLTALIIKSGPIKFVWQTCEICMFARKSTSPSRCASINPLKDEGKTHLLAFFSIHTARNFRNISGDSFGSFGYICTQHLKKKKKESLFPGGNFSFFCLQSLRYLKNTSWGTNKHTFTSTHVQHAQVVWVVVSLLPVLPVCGCLYVCLQSLRELWLSAATFPGGRICWLRHQRVVMLLVGARKPGHISCGNRVIVSPITTAITAGGPQESGNEAYRHTDGHTWEGIKKWFNARHTYKTRTNTHADGVCSETRGGML